MDVLRVENLHKSFGEKQVLKGLGFAVPEHSVFGFVGRNGAGKSTTMKIALGLLKADQGEVYVMGDKVRYGNASTNRCVGYLPDVPEFYDFMTAREYLGFCGDLSGMEKKAVKERSEQLLEMVGLSDEKKRVKGFSRGMKQRLGLAQALLHRPKLLICDEPTSALDPLGRRELLDILEKAKDETTVLFSTHILSDVESICDRVAVLEKGNVVLSGTIDEIRNSHGQGNVTLALSSEAECKKLADRFDFLTREEHHTVNAASPDRLPELLKFIAEEKLNLMKLERGEATLEDLFMEVISEEPADKEVISR